MVKDELAEQRKLAARLTEEFAKLKPEQPESSSARQITKIAPKPFVEQKKVSKPGENQYVLKQEKAEMKGETMVTEVHDKPAPEEKGKAKNDDAQEPRGSKAVVQDQLKTPEKKVRFVEETSTIPDGKQWLPVNTKTATKEVEEAGKSPAVEVDVKEKPLKRSNKMLRQDESRSKKAAKVQAEWRRVRVNESSTSCCSSSESSGEEDQVIKPEVLIDGARSVKENISKPNNQEIKGKGTNKKWVPKPVENVSASEPSSAEGSEIDEEKEYIYTQVCRRINQLTLELDKLRKALPACEAFLDKYKKHKHQAQSEVMSATTLVVKDDQVPVIQVECKVRKHWKPVNNVVIDGGAGVNIMAEHTRRNLGITDMKEAPFRVRMADQRVVQPLGLVENIQVKAGGAKFSVSFLVLDVGDAYSMLLGRPWLKVAEALHDWTTNTITLKSKGKKVVLSTNSKKVEETKKPELLCQKQTPKQIEKMLATMNIIPTAEIDLNIVMADLEKAQEQRELFPDSFQESVAGTRTISKIGQKAGNNDNESGDGESGTENYLKPKQLKKKQIMATSGSSGEGCKDMKKHSDDDENNDNQGMRDKASVTQVAQEPVWMVPDDQAVEEWNLGTAEDPKTIRVNKNLPDEFKTEARRVFEEFKDVFAWEHEDLKGVDPKVCQHRIPLIPDAKPV